MSEAVQNAARIWGMLTFFILFYLGTGQSLGEIFKYTDRQGNPSYTNQRAKIPKEFQKNVEVIQEENLPPLKVAPDPPPAPPINKTPGEWPPKTKVIVSLLLIVLGISMFFIFLLKNFKNPMGRFGFKIIIAGAVGIGLCTYILFQFNQIQSGESENSKNGQLNLFPTNKVQQEVKKIEENMKKQEEILKSISKEDESFNRSSTPR